jgi:hypothetical protein
MTTDWGNTTVIHTDVDDDPQARAFMKAKLMENVTK